MSGGDGNGPGNTGLGHNGGRPSGNINGTSGSGPSGGNTGGWHWADAPWSKDPDGSVRINFVGTRSYPTTPKGGSGGSGSKNQARFIANVTNWHLGYNKTGSLNSPSLLVLRGGYYQVSFGRELYQVSYDPERDVYNTVFVSGSASRADQLMNGQAIAVVQLYIISQNEKSLLLKTSSIIADAGEKIASNLSAKYSALSRELANDISAFQGKKIRSYNDAIKSINQLMGGTLSHYSAADKTAIVNALKSINAMALATNLKSLAKSFTIADRALKIESIAEKTIHGIQTGEWGPLALELEAMVMSGIAGGIALGLIGAIIGQIALSATVLSAVSFMAIVLVAVTSSFIDADFAARVNNEIESLIKK
ncbi:TPA: hypothetical protein N2P13_000762 [Citrobacter freundii]|nr:hypothetical protein [Citrobacter freundii]HCL6179560.1 hypothetical protein [Citrobacter freundii]